MQLWMKQWKEHQWVPMKETHRHFAASSHLGRTSKADLKKRIGLAM
jgi:hypothetical protein